MTAYSPTRVLQDRLTTLEREAEYLKLCHSQSNKTAFDTYTYGRLIMRNYRKRESLVKRIYNLTHKGKANV